VPRVVEDDALAAAVATLTPGAAERYARPMRFAGWLALLLLVAPGPVHGDRCPRGGCDFGSSTTASLSPTTSTTLPAEEVRYRTRAGIRRRTTVIWS